MVCNAARERRFLRYQSYLLRDVHEFIIYVSLRMRQRVTVVTKKKVMSAKTIRTMGNVSHGKKVSQNESRPEHETMEINRR